MNLRSISAMKSPKKNKDEKGFVSFNKSTLDNLDEAKEICEKYIHGGVYTGEIKNFEERLITADLEALLSFVRKRVIEYGSATLLLYIVNRSNYEDPITIGVERSSRSYFTLTYLRQYEEGFGPRKRYRILVDYDPDFDCVRLFIARAVIDHLYCREVYSRVDKYNEAHYRLSHELPESLWPED